MIHTPDPHLCAALAADFASADYTTDRIRALAGSAADGALGRGTRVPARRVLRDARTPVAIISRLFGLGDAIPLADAELAFPTVGSTGLVDLDLARIDDDRLVPTALVNPLAIGAGTASREWWIASDLDEEVLGGALPVDHVLGVGGASVTLAGLQVSGRARRVLDLGTGCGIQALRARLSADEVVATDISRRALWFTRQNALLNGVDGIITREGNLFDPVAGERFDRIVSNPPFVITPRVEGVPLYEYRDGGQVGDALVRAVVTGVGDHLEPGGIAQLLGNWEYHEGESGLDRVRGWVAESDEPLDAWVIERELLDPVAYAELWIRDGGTTPGAAGHDELLAAWLDDFDRRGVTAVGFGYLLLRRPLAGAPTLSRYERIDHPLGDRALGDELATSLGAHDRLEMLDDDGIAASVLTVADDVTEARHYLPGDADPRVIELRQGGGFGRTIGADPAVAALVGACDGDLSVGVLIAAIAQLMEVDPDELRDELLPRVRSLLVDGFLRFVD